MFLVYSVARGESFVFSADKDGRACLEGCGVINVLGPARLTPSDCIWMVPGTIED